MNTILIVEDNEMNLELATTILEANGFSTLTALNGLEAISVATADHPDLILMDIQMPGMDGFEACTRLQGDESNRTIPVVAVTGNATNTDLEKIMGHGFAGYLTKPYRISALVDTVKKFTL